MIYLDNNASTPVDFEVAHFTYSALKGVFGNPSSSHEFGSRSKSTIDKARSEVAALIGVSSEEIIFTSGGTESNNLAIIGLADRKKKGHIISSVIEHPSVLNPCRHLEGRGFDCSYLGVGTDGRVTVEDIRRAIRKDTVLITIMHANNETGVLQPLEEIGKLAREREIIFHADAAQTIGKIPVNAQQLNVDMLTIVSHKFYGPKGIGALYIRKGIEVSPILFGAGHENGLRPGTENVHGIAGLGKACEIAGFSIHKRASRVKRVTEMLLHALRSKIDGLRLNGHETHRLPNTLNVCIPGVDALILLDRIKDRVAASAGSACHAGHKKPSSVLTAMGLSDADAMSSIRLSTGKDTTEDEIKEAVEIIAKAVEELKK
ncbi:MAG TPA: cysteine desulfurase family protein [Thermodesulfovibrionales bacterium]|nr:cysteine desulfurase family protein [Thermodesulfovibrionales bacterium]